MYLSHAEASEYLGIKSSTLYNWVHAGLLIPKKLGKFNRFKMSDLDTLFEDKEEVDEELREIMKERMTKIRKRKRP